MSRIKVLAAVVEEKSQPFTIAELELDEPRDDEVLVRVVATGVCHTDLAMREQYLPIPFPIVLGHEGAGIVERIGKGVKKVKPGDHVILTYPSCGICANCKKGYPYSCNSVLTLCFAGSRLDGSTTLNRNGQSVHGSFFGQSSFATHVLAYESNTLKVPKDLPLEILGPLGCGIQTGAGAVFNSLHPRAGSSLAVFGSGAVGMSAIMAGVVVGCTTIIGIDIKPNRLELARSLGATHTVNADKEDPLEAVRQFTGGGANYTLETTGQPSVFRQAVESLGPLGICGLIGLARGGTEVSFEWNSILLSRKIYGIVEGESVPDVFIPQLIELYRQGRFPFDRLITFYPLDDINKAVEDSEEGKTVKPVLQMAAG